MYLVCGEALFDFFAQADTAGFPNKVGFNAITVISQDQKRRP